MSLVITLSACSLCNPRPVGCCVSHLILVVFLLFSQVYIALLLILPLQVLQLCWRFPSCEPVFIRPFNSALLFSSSSLCLYLSLLFVFSFSSEPLPLVFSWVFFYFWFLIFSMLFVLFRFPGSDPVLCSRRFLIFGFPYVLDFPCMTLVLDIDYSPTTFFPASPWLHLDPFPTPLPGLWHSMYSTKFRHKEIQANKNRRAKLNRKLVNQSKVDTQRQIGRKKKG